MNTLFPFGRTTCALILTGLCLTANPAGAAVREVFDCSYRDGADRSDLMKARDYLIERSDAIGLSEMQAFLWTPYKVANYQGDFLWFNSFPDLNAFAAAANAYASTDAGRAVAQRFDRIVTCNSSLADVELVHEPKQPLDFEPPALLASYACTLKPGQNATSVRDVITHYQDVLAATGLHDDHAFYAVTPLLGTGEIDRYFFGVHADLPAWAARETAMQTSEAAAMFGRHVDQVMDCASALWWGEPIIPVPEE